MAYPPAPPPAQPVPPQKTGNGFGIAALVLGIIGLLAGLIPVIGIFIGIPLGILALIFGIVAAVSSKNRVNNAGKGTGITGIILGILAIVAAIAWTVLLYDAWGDACEEAGYSGDAAECSDQINQELDDLENELEDLETN